MDYRVVFSPTAILDLAESVSYIARHDSEAAARIGESLINAAEPLLVKQPRIGPICPEYPDSEVRYWLHKGYRVVYEIDDTTKIVGVLRFWHCSKGDWPTSLK